jgi:hypothetical protein
LIGCGLRAAGDHVTGHLTRTLNALGLKREPIDVTPVLNEYLSTLPAETQDCSGCFRLERLAGRGLHPLESAALSRRTRKAVIRR